jgi:ribosomal protein S18 acetylase RimI-like enzyme
MDDYEDDIDFGGEDEDDDRGDMEEETQYHERNVMERVSIEDPFSELFEKPEPADEKEHKFWVKSLTKRERFFFVLREVINDCQEKIERVDKKLIVEKVKNLDGIQYKNPWGFILGYLASKGGQKLSKLRVKDIISKVPPDVSKEYGIQPADVVRYARFWNLYL